jgi:dihydropyrimidinase
MVGLCRMSLLIRNGRVITAEDDHAADILVEGETVSKIAPGLKVKADTVLDARGKLVIPGGIDPHTHFDMPVAGTVSSDDFETGTIAAVCGGTTTVIDFAAQVKGRSMPEGLERWRKRADGNAVIDYGCHMTVCDLPESRLPEMSRLVKEGVTSFKMFTAYPGRFLLSDDVIFRAMQRIRKLGALACIHAENGTVIQELIDQALHKGHVQPKYHAQTRPPCLEAEAVNRMACLASLTGAAVYIVHLSSAEALDAVRRARERGVKMWAETCPQYLFLDESEYERGPEEAAKYVMSPPLRDKAAQKKLWQGLASGDIHCVGTDHCPFWWDEKRKWARRNFTKIPGGGPGVENRMSLMYHGGVAEGRMSLHRFVEITSTAAARIFGLYPKKGTIAVGSDADLVVFDPDRKERISVGSVLTHHMRVDYNLYEGMKVQGFPQVVLSKGKVVARDGRFVGRKGAGCFLKRGRM